MIGEARIGDFHVDWVSGEINDGRTVVRLEPRVLHVLWVLSEHAGETVTRRHLYATVWGDSPGAEQSLNTAISTLRRAFGDRRDTPTYIRTVPRLGYCLLVRPESVAAQAPETDAGTAPPSRPPRRRQRVRAGMVIAGIGMLLTGLVTYLSFASSSTDTEPRALAIQVDTFETDEESAHVRYLAFGLPEDIRRSLSGQPDLVIGLPGQSPGSLAAPSVADVLHITGAFEVEDGEIALSLAIRSRSREDVAPFVRRIAADPGNLIDLRAQILNEVSLGVHLMDVRRTGSGKDGKTSGTPRTTLSDPALPPGATQNEKAYEHYLIGSYLFWRTTPGDLAEAIWQIEQAVSLDPGFAQAYEALGNLYFFAGSHYGHLPNSLALPKAREALRRAIELDPALPQAWATYADFLLCADHDVKAAGRALERTLNLNPNFAHMVIARYRLRTGDLEGMTSFLEDSLARYPTSAWSFTAAAWHYFEAGMTDRARETVDRALVLDPDYADAHKLRGRLDVLEGREEDAIAAFDKAVLLSGGNSNYRLARAVGLARLGLGEKALAELSAVEASGKPVNPVHETMVLAAVGRTQEALSALERAVQDRQIALCFLDFDPAYAPLRTLPRFEEILARLNFD